MALILLLCFSSAVSAFFSEEEPLCHKFSLADLSGGSEFFLIIQIQLISCSLLKKEELLILTVFFFHIFYSLYG